MQVVHGLIHFPRTCLSKIELQSKDQADDQNHIPHLTKHENIILVHCTVLQSYCNTVSACL